MKLSTAPATPVFIVHDNGTVTLEYTPDNLCLDGELLLYQGKNIDKARQDERVVREVRLERRFGKDATQLQ